MTKARDFTWIYKNYKGKWVALTLDEKTVVASGPTLKKVLELSSKKGLDHPVVMRVPMEVLPFVGSSQIVDED